MGILKRLSLVVRSYIATANDKLDAIAADEELRSAQSSKQARDELAKALERIGSLDRPAPPAEANHAAGQAGAGLPAAGVGRDRGAYSGGSGLA